MLPRVSDVSGILHDKFLVVAMVIATPSLATEYSLIHKCIEFLLPLGCAFSGHKWHMSSARSYPWLKWTLVADSQTNDTPGEW